MQSKIPVARNRGFPPWIVQNEVFGPVLTPQTFEDEAQAVALVNGTRYGLSGVVYTRDKARAQRIGRAVRAGTVWVNCFLVRDLTAPFGGSCSDRPIWSARRCPSTRCGRISRSATRPLAL